MQRSTALVLAGVLCLVAAVAVPVVGLLVAEWDSDYVYTVETEDSYCADVVHENPETEGMDGYRVDYQNLSSTGKAHVERAVADGRYVVGNEAETAPDFVFTDDHVAAGAGCYAINYSGETYALRTSIDSRRVGPTVGLGPALIGWLLIAVGATALLAGVSLLITGRLK